MQIPGEAVNHGYSTEHASMVWSREALGTWWGQESLCGPPTHLGEGNAESPWENLSHVPWQLHQMATKNSPTELLSFTENSGHMILWNVNDTVKNHTVVPFPWNGKWSYLLSPDGHKATFAFPDIKQGCPYSTELMNRDHVPVSTLGILKGLICNCLHSPEGLPRLFLVI